MKNEKHRQLPRKPTEQHTTVICYNYTNTQTHVVPKHDCPVRSCSFVETMCTFVSASSLLMTTLSGLWVSGVSERECVFVCVGMCDETRRLSYAFVVYYYLHMYLVLTLKEDTKNNL